MKNFESDLADMKFQFGDDFEQSVMSQIDKKNREGNQIIIAIQRITSIAAMLIVGLFVWQSYTSETDSTYENLLGLTEDSTEDISEVFEEYYSTNN